MGCSSKIDVGFRKKAEANSVDSMIMKKAIRDFDGIDDADPNTVKGVMDFSFHLAMGDMDNAFKSIHYIRNRMVWENLAKICVKSRRLDVAELCLSNMGHLTAIKALRRMKTNAEPEVRAATIAMYLGMDDEVERLLGSCNRFDLLNRFYQSCGRWEKSIEVAGSKDRINLKTTYNQFGRHLSELGDVSGALAAFEKSATYSYNIPKLLLPQLNQLEKYIFASEDKNLKKWWAQFAESQGDFNTALSYYEAAGDILSVVRVHCFCGSMQQAIDIAEKTKDPAAAYHIARHYENERKASGRLAPKNGYLEAISFYSSAKCFRHAIQIAKENRLDLELMQLALQSTPAAMVDAARYFEMVARNYDKAITLNFKGGNVGKAIELCFQTKNFNLLREIAASLDDATDPKVLRKCALFFTENCQFEKAVGLLVKAKDYDQALKICLENDVLVTEELADQMDVKQNGAEEGADGSQKSLLLRIADICLQQRSYHLACKKYTQAGDRVKAMKSLLQSGDTEKIIFFANVSGPKQREIFVIAANYLQSLDWRSNPTVMKAIITFYTKALGALKEALKCMGRSKTAGSKEVKTKVLQRRVDLVSKFVEARKFAKSHAVEMFHICEQLLQELDVDDAVRIGDIFALMIEEHYANGSLPQAAQLLNRMKAQLSQNNVEYYIDKRIIQAVDSSYARPKTAKGGEIEEEIDAM
ncbi:hypothetical protein HK102_003585 [Quaeritorhiza haematococci]|nr:hypothetical protein HK102_003585 [Quaeritorhiza haematococci]